MHIPVFIIGYVATSLPLALILVFYSYRKASNARFLLEAVLEKSRAGRVVFDGHGQSYCHNKEMERLVGGEPTIESLAAVFSHPASSAETFTSLKARAAAGESIQIEMESNRGGNTAWYSVDVHPVRGWPGFVQWRIGDLTQRLAREEDRRIERAKLIDFLDNAPGGFFSVDAEGKFLFVNQTFAEWIGASVEDFIAGKHRLHDILETPPDGKPYDIINGGGLVQHGEVVFRGVQGQLFPAAIAQTVVRDSDEAIRTRAVVRDLLQEREWQDALAQSQRRFQRFFEDAPLGIVLVDAKGVVIECNKMAMNMIGGPGKEAPEETKALYLEDFLVPPDCARIVSLMQGEIPGYPIEVKLKGEGDRTAQLYLRLLHEVGAERIVILHFIDLTEQKNLEKQFGQSQKMQAVGQLAGGIAHDFNNLLTAMIGFCDLLLLKHKPGDPSFGDIMQIKQNANRAANLVRQLLAFSRQQTLQPRVLDVTDALTELLHLLRRLIGENIELKMIHGRELGLIKADQGQFEQVLINLCVNARDAMPRGGKLTIRTSNRRSRTPIRLAGEEMPAGEWVVISVADTGTGIPPEIIGRIFEPFFSTKEVGSGTGLGLSTVYGIVRQTGGYVHVESIPGEGTTFFIYLPRHVEVESQQVAPPAPDSGQEKSGGDLTGAGHILLVEDEDAVRMFSARALRNKGYEVHEANSGEAALNVMATTEKPIDLLITDVIMPQMDGPTLVEVVRRTQPDLKVIFISGYTEDRVRSQFAANEEIHFLAKPFTLKQLASKVKEVMFPEK
jgi:two-component system cell cycle sensor histidine kinase/response regulator CckA